MRGDSFRRWVSGPLQQLGLVATPSVSPRPDCDGRGCPHDHEPAGSPSCRAHQPHAIVERVDWLVSMVPGFWAGLVSKVQK
jgi:hypothetical protein